MVDALSNPSNLWFVTIVLECIFLGFCSVFIGLGLTELKKKKNRVRNMTLVGVGITLAILSLWTTYLLLQGRA